MKRPRFLVTIATLLLFTAIPSIIYAGSLTQYQQNEQKVKIQQANTKSQISALSQQASELKTKVELIQSQIDKLQSTIDQTVVNIQLRNTQIAKLRAELIKTNAQLVQQKHLLDDRIRVMYEAGQTSYLEVLFSATSFSDLMVRLQLLTLIAQQDKRMFTNIELSEHHLQTTNHALQQRQAAERKAYADLNVQKSTQQSAQVTERSLLSRVGDKKLEQQAELHSENVAMQGLKSLVQQLEAQGQGYTGAAGGWVWPIPSTHQISSPYGWRSWPDGSKEFHNGIDIPASVGTPMVSATNGKVLYAGPATGFGDWIVIQSAGGLIEIYGHMYSWEIYVTPGEIVKAGQKIAGVGSNGFSTGPHLHFTIASGFDSNGFAISINPLKYV